MKRTVVFLVVFFAYANLVGMAAGVGGYDDLSTRLEVLRAQSLLESAQQHLNASYKEGVALARTSLPLLRQLPAACPQAPGARSMLSWLDNVSWFDLTVAPVSLAALFVIVKHALR